MTVRCSIPFNGDIRLAGLLDVPDGDEFPLVVLLHGFTGWKEEGHLASLAAALQARGIGAMRFDAPGAGESGGTYADDYRMSNYLDSVERALSWAHHNLPVGRKPIGIWGHSMGGFVAIASAVRLGTFAAVVASQSSVGRQRFTEDGTKHWEASGWSTFHDGRTGGHIELPYGFYLDRQKYDVFEVIGALNAPLLVIAGNNDDIAPVSQVRSIYDAAPEPKTYLEFPADHFYKRDPRQLSAINNATVEFLAAHLAGTSVEDR